MATIINLAWQMGSLLCFQWGEATFTVGQAYFPVCAGCFGIYLGSLIALTAFPFLKTWPKKLCSFKFGLLLVLPMVVYWTVLNIERTLDFFPVPAIKELYSITGVLLGIAVANAALSLSLETRYHNVVRRVARRFWVPVAFAVMASLAVFFLYPFEEAAVFSVSLIFLLGFLGLVAFIALWAIASVLSLSMHEKLSVGKALVSVATLFVIVVCFMFFQVMVGESRLDLVVGGLLLGTVSFVVFGHSLRSFSLADLGMTGKNWIRQVTHGVMIAFALYGCFAVYRYAASPAGGLILPHTGFDALTVLVVLAIVVSEEFFFRGYAVQLLRRHMNATAAGLMSSLFFVVYHESFLFQSVVGIPSVSSHSLEHVVILFAGGFLLSYFFIREKSLVMPIVIHFVWNLLIFSSVAYGDPWIFP